MTTAYLALGSNLGDRDAHLAAARTLLFAGPDPHLVRASPIEETAPLGGMDQPAYLNQMLRVETQQDARALLAFCLGIEQRLGRERHAFWGSRTLDIDLVRYDHLLCDHTDLRVPHPGLRDRPFWVRAIAHLEAHD